MKEGKSPVEDIFEEELGRKMSNKEYLICNAIVYLGIIPTSVALCYWMSDQYNNVTSFDTGKLSYEDLQLANKTLNTLFLGVFDTAAVYSVIRKRKL